MKSLVAAAVMALAGAQPAWALGERPFVAFEAGKDAVVLARAGQAARIVVDPDEFKGVRRASSTCMRTVRCGTGKESSRTAWRNSRRRTR